MSQDHGQDEGQAPARIMPRNPSGKGKLLHIADYEPVQVDRIIGELRGYWEGLRQGRAIPARGDVEPRGIRRALDYAFILERIAPGAARFRLAGRHLIDLMGMEVRGMPLCSFLNTSSRGRLSDVLESVFRGPQIAEMVLESPATYGRPGLTGRLLLMPLRSDLGDVTRALGCLISQGEMGESPRRFDLISDAEFPVIPGAKVLEPSPSRAGFAEPPAPWKAARPVAETDPQKAGPQSGPLSVVPPAPSPGGAPSAGSAAPGDAPSTPEERRARFRLINMADPPRPRGTRF